MPKKTKNICEECSRTSNMRTGCWRFGHWFCVRCKKKNRFPNLFKKIYGNIEPKKKKRKKWRNFKREEQIVLYHKHVKDMSVVEFKDHMNKMKGIVDIVKKVSRKNKPSLDFKSSFSELTTKRVRE